MTDTKPTNTSRPPQGRDPKLLLNPRSNTTKATSTNGVHSSNEQPANPAERSRGNIVDNERPATADVEPKRLMESFYGVEQRTAKPKRIKVSHDPDEDNPMVTKGSHQHHATGIVGDYLKPTAEEGPTEISSIVDLTNGRLVCNLFRLLADTLVKNRKTTKSRSQALESFIKRFALVKSHLWYLLGLYPSQRKTAVISQSKVNGP